MMNLWGREPVMVMAIIQSGIALIIGFGVPMSAEQTAAILAFSAAVLGFITRSQVAPAAK